MAKKAKKKTGGKKAGAKKTVKKAVMKRSSGGKLMVAKRADLGDSADGYFGKIGGPLGAVAGRLRQIVREAAPQASEAIKWGMPVYEFKGMLCYIRARGGYVTLGFYHQGVHLSDPDKLLEGTGENMRHMKVRSAADIKGGLFTQWVKQAVVINADA
jgi:hypothetical protein